MQEKTINELPMANDGIPRACPDKQAMAVGNAMMSSQSLAPVKVGGFDMACETSCPGVLEIKEERARFSPLRLFSTTKIVRICPMSSDSRQNQMSVN